MYIVIAIIVLCFGLVLLRGAPYVPTHRRQLERLFTEVHPLTASDVVVDLGAGDGVVLAVAAAHGARAIGYELNPLLWLFLQLRFWGRSSVRPRLADYNLLRRLPRDTTVVYAFTTSHSIETIGRKLGEWSQYQTIYFISYGFELAQKTPLRSRDGMHVYKFAKH